MATRTSGGTSKSASGGKHRPKGRRASSPKCKEPTLLTVAEERWREMCVRLRLSEAAAALGASLLRAELDPEERTRIMPGEPGGTAVRRGRLKEQQVPPMPPVYGAEPGAPKGQPQV